MTDEKGTIFFVLFIMVSCEQAVETPQINYVQSPIIEEDPKEPIDDEQEEITMEVLAIKWFDNYVLSSGNVFGIDGSKLVPVEFKSKEGGTLKPVEFFKKSGKIFFSIQTFESDKENKDNPAVETMLYFSQEGDTISAIAKIPAMPESDRIELDSAPFQIKKTSYGEIPTSTLMRDTLQEAYLCIDGASKVDGGLWYSVPEGYGKTRLEGVYFWGLKGSKIRVKNSGRIF